MSDIRHPWGQQPQEPLAGYNRFLAYRNLGPGRTLDAAYVSYKKVRLSLPSNTLRAPGSWRKESARWNWCARAAAYDTAMLGEAGREIVTTYISCLRTLAAKTLTAMADEKLKPKGWKQIFEAVAHLNSMVPPELVKHVADAGKTPAAAEEASR